MIIVSFVGIFNSWFIFSMLLDKLLSLFISDTVVLYLAAIEYRLSPFFTTYVMFVPTGSTKPGIINF